MGPYTAEDARAALRQLRRDRLVPRDSFVQFSSRLQRQFFPIGAQFYETAPAAPDATAQVREPTPTQAQAVTPTVETGELSPVPQIFPQFHRYTFLMKRAPRRKDQNSFYHGTTKKNCNAR
ncbi:hypothetical protein [Nereida sp.]|uniref:hypothetical protein n=1 Tax=Nereida sp. TaxID=2736090 RepID=UPI003F69858F